MLPGRVEGGYEGGCSGDHCRPRRGYRGRDWGGCFRGEDRCAGGGNHGGSWVGGGGGDVGGLGGGTGSNGGKAGGRVCRGEDVGSDGGGDGGLVGDCHGG